MRFSKKTIILLIVLLASIAFAACSSGDVDTDKEENADTGNTNEDTYVLQVSHNSSTDHTYQDGLEAFKEGLERDSEGRIEVEIFPDGQLYASEREAVEAVQLNNIEMTVIGVPSIAGFQPEFDVFSLPFLFDSRDAAHGALDGELGEELNNLLPEIDLVNLGYGENGFRHFFNTQRPIKKPEDYSDLKVRVIENKLYEDMFTMLGANASPLGFGELYSALQQGVYDGADSEINVAYAGKFNEVMNYMTISEHTFMPAMLLMNKDALESLPSDLQDLVREHGKNSWVAKQREANIQKEDERLEELGQDIDIYELTPDEKELFKEKLEPIYEEYTDVIGEDIIKLAQEANQ